MTRAGAVASEVALRDPYRMAAVAYGVYGTVYLVGAILELDPSRQVTHWGFVPWWAFYVAGALLLFTLPIFVWRGVRWLAFTLSFFCAVKAFWLSWLQGRAVQQGDETTLYNWLFAAVAAVAAGLLLRAGLTGGSSTEEHQGRDDA